MPSDTLYGNKYKYILAGFDAASRYKVVRPLRTKQACEIAEMIADIYKVRPLTYSKIFQCDNGSELNNKKKRSHTQLDSRKQVIAFQDRVITINIKEAQHPLKREKQVIDKSSIMLKISTKSMH